MADDYDEDIFADLYEEDEPAKPAVTVPATKPEADINGERDVPVTSMETAPAVKEELPDNDGHMGTWNGNVTAEVKTDDDNYGPINVKEDGKMFIGGLNWETTEDSLRDYFSEFGEVSECTVMRDSTTGRSRGFGFLTFKDPKCVNIVMVKEHFLDGKIIDPKRAIPREEQERTSKIFVGGVSQEATEEDFKNFFKQFGRVVDATLMMDKDTGRPRGFGFVTFDGDSAVDACLQAPLQILGKPIEVKRAQPRGNMREEEEGKKFGRGKFGGRDSGPGGSFDASQNASTVQAGGSNGMTPAMMAQYWQKMQSYFRTMQERIATSANGGMPPNPMGNMVNMGGMNPAMMNMMAGGQPNPMGGQMPGGMMPGFNPSMMAAMGNQGGGFGGNQGGFGGNQGMMGGPRPQYGVAEQQAFEQHNRQEQERRRMQQQGSYANSQGPTSWEGMYDDIPQPSIPQGPGGHRMHGGGGGGGNFGPGKSNRSRQGSSQPPAGNAPANAPTGPKNAGKPGANYRGGGRSQNYRHNPYGGRG